MTFKRIAVALVAFGLVGGAVMAKPAEVKKGAAKKEDPMMAAMAKNATPGPQHKMMKGMVGTWAVAGKMWMEPGKPPVESTYTAEMKAVGDLWCTEDMTGTFMGKPFIGHGIHGYDNAKAKFVGVWVDNMGSWIMSSEGTADATGKIITSTGNEFDPLTGKTGVAKSVMTAESDTKHKMEMFKTGADGKEVKMMELVYTKK